MKLVWTYNILAKVGNKTDERKIILINYYLLSISNAKKMGYYCIIYTDSFSAQYFEGIADEVNIFDNYENSVQWDCYKIRACEERDDNFVLMDGDIILHSKLPPMEDDVVFDTYEVANWKDEYEPVINQFTKLGIADVVDVWCDIRKPVFSCGILYFKEDSYRKFYVEQWKKYNNFLNEILKTNEVDIDVATMVGGQYLVTLCANHLNLSRSFLTPHLGAVGKSYKHHCGNLKYHTPIVPTDRIIKPSKKILL